VLELVIAVVAVLGAAAVVHLLAPFLADRTERTATRHLRGR